MSKKNRKYYNCEHYYPNGTCYVKKVSSIAGTGYLTFWDKLFCKSCEAFRERQKHKLPTEKSEKASCAGCKHLDYYNDGSGICVKGLDHACIASGFQFREPKESEE